MIMISKGKLYDLYVNKYKNCEEISYLFGCTRRTVANKLRKYRMYIRPGGNKGKSFNNEWRSNMSFSHQGRTAWNKGVKRSEAAKRKLRIAVKAGAYTGINQGRNNPAWSGWASRINYGIKFNLKLKRKIRKRDKNICQLCKKRKYGKELAVHHIDYNKKNCKDSNLISLHDGCNCKVNADRDYWYAYFTYIKRGE